MSQIKHIVTFKSPGTFVNESTDQDIPSWDVEEAVRRAKLIRERYHAQPFAFYFKTLDLENNKVIRKSANYFLGGKILSLLDIVRRNNPEDKILISNMRINQIEAVVQTHSPYLSTNPLREGDVVLPFP